MADVTRGSGPGQGGTEQWKDRGPDTSHGSPVQSVGQETRGAASLAHVPVTVVIPTLNEAARIAELVADLAWAGEVIVVDGGSSDGTDALAARAGARVMSVTERTIADQRNAGIEAARHLWVLTMDADERVTPELREELDRLAREANPAFGAYRVRSRNWYLGRELRHGPYGRDWKTRVFTREHRYEITRVHEHIVSTQPVGRLQGMLLHHPYRGVMHHVSKVITYARWGARDLHARGRRARVSDFTVRPAWRFFRDYILWSGWRDGVPGFIASAIGAFAAFLKYAGLWGIDHDLEL